VFSVRPGRRTGKRSGTRGARESMARVGCAGSAGMAIFDAGAAGAAGWADILWTVSISLLTVNCL
jgi:hypothetical protein